MGYSAVGSLPSHAASAREPASAGGREHRQPVARDGNDCGPGEGREAREHGQVVFPTRIGDQPGHAGTERERPRLLRRDLQSAKQRGHLAGIDVQDACVGGTEVADHSPGRARVLRRAEHNDDLRLGQRVRGGGHELPLLRLQYVAGQFAGQGARRPGPPGRAIAGGGEPLVEAHAVSGAQRTQGERAARRGAGGEHRVRSEHLARLAPEFLSGAILPFGRRATQTGGDGEKNGES